MSTNETSWQLRGLLSPDTTGEDETVDRLRERLDAFMAEQRSARAVDDVGGAQRLQRPRNRPFGARRTVAVAAMCVTLVAGVAAAADRGILFSDKPTIDRVEVLRGDAPESSRVPDATAQDYTTFAWPIPNDKGAPLPDERARILVDYMDDVRSVRIVAVPTTKGHLCYSVTGGPIGNAAAQKSQMCGEFRPGWPLIESASNTNGVVDYYYGIAADEVDEVSFLSGETKYPATMGRNSYVWAPPNGSSADTIEVVFEDSSVARRDLGVDQVKDPYQEPYIVRLGE